ncbi:MAG: tryptophan synthase subunit alpha [Clostridia bacterium]|nr:tryptophan synthase subunit alpha [Clostridia bacterium]
MNKIASAFQNGKAFIPFITCGDPDLDTTAALIRAAAKSGADLIELGIPFSDPTAEGPVIQQANLRALSGGVTTDRIFEMLRAVRPEVATPIVFMTYANVVFSYGTERFLSTCAELSIDGIILPDIPCEERDDFRPACQKYGVQFVSAISPNSAGRIPMIARDADCYVCIADVRRESTEQLAEVAAAVHANTELPCVIRLDDVDSPQYPEILSAVDGVVLTCAIVNLVSKHGKDVLPHAEQLMKTVREQVKKA